MIRVIGCGHLEKGGNGWNSERKGVFLCGKARVFW